MNDGPTDHGDDDAIQDPVDRLAEEFAARIRRGEDPSVEEYARQHPHWANRIRCLFPTIKLVEHFKPAESEDVADNLRGVDTELPSRIGDYRILGEIGRGGMGVVYEAEQVSLGRHVALKVFTPGVKDSRQAIERFRREARAAAKLHHSNIVPVFGVGQEEDRYYYAMQFIQGRPLADVLVELQKLANQPHTRTPNAPTDVRAASAAHLARQLAPGEHRGGQVPPPSRTAPCSSSNRARIGNTDASPSQSDALPLTASDASPSTPRNSPSGLSRADYWRCTARIGIQVADALQHAHAHNILHRDIKPSNLLLDTRGTVWVTDFGLAKVFDDDDDITGSNDVLGTLRYMSPEACQGRADHRTDLYGLGLVLYELATLRPAFDSAARHTLARQVTEARAVPVGTRNRGVPRDLQTIITKLLERDPADRYQSARAVKEDLQRFLEGKPIHARRFSRFERTWRWGRRNPVTAALVVTTVCLILLLAVAGPVAALHQSRIADERRQLLYTSDMHLVYQAWQTGNLDGMTELLTRHIPRQREQDLRNFEWYHLWHLCHPTSVSYRGRAPLRAIARSPDNKVLAIGDTQGNISLWDIAGGRELDEWQAHQAEVLDIKFAPDGQMLASGGWDGAVRLWEFPTGRPLMQISGHLDRDGVMGRNSIDLSPDGKRLAYCAVDSRIVVLDPSGRAPPRSLVNHQALSVVLRDSGTLLSVGQDRRIRMWDLETGDFRTVGPVFEDWVRNLEVSENGRLLAATDYCRVLVWDLIADQELRTLELPNIESMEFTPDDKYLALGSVNSTIDILATDDWTVQRTLKGHSGAVMEMVFSESGEELYSVGQDSQIHRWDLEKIAERSVIRTGPRALKIAFSPSGESIALHSGTHYQQPKGVSIWDWQSARAMATADPIAVHPDFVAFGENDHTVLFSTSPGDRDRTYSLYEPFEIAIWNPQTDSRIALRLPDETSCIALSDNRRTLVSGDKYGKISVWDASTGELLKRFQTPIEMSGRRMHSIAVSPDGRLVAAGGRTIGLWDIESERLLRTYPVEPTEFFNPLAFSPNGKWLAAGCEDNTIKLLPVNQPGTSGFRTLRGHAGPVRCVAFSPDGTRLASGGDDLFVKLWDVRTGLQLLSLEGHTRPVYGVDFSPDIFPDSTPDGLTLASAGADGTIRLWETAASRNR